MAKSDWSFFENIGGDDETQAKISLQTVPQIKNGKRGKRSLEITWEKGEDGYVPSDGLQGSLAFVRETESLVENQGYQGTIWVKLLKSALTPSEDDDFSLLLSFDSVTNASTQEEYSDLEEIIRLTLPALFITRDTQEFE
jgi:hypothetical protein